MFYFHFLQLGFPLGKAVEYTKMHQPFLINDVEAQFLLQDRRAVYRILKENNIETPRFAVCDRNAAKGYIFLFRLFEFRDI